MTDPAYTDFQVGGSVLPLTAALTNTALRDSDPTLFYGLDFWSWVIGEFVGPRLLAEAGNAPAFPAIGIAVAQQYPWPPNLEYEANQFRFPLLAAYRKESVYQWKEIGWYSDRTTFDLVYSLPPMTAGHCQRFVPVLRSIERAIAYKTQQGYDNLYTPPGGSAGQQPWSLPFASVQEIGFDRGAYVNLPAAGNLQFPTLLMSGFVVERAMYLPGTKFAGGDINLGLTAPDGTTIANVIQASTQQAPTVTSLSPNTGAHAGGTSVTITGTLFLPAAFVQFGALNPVPATYVSATSLTCTTPAALGAGVVNVQVINRDGQTGTLANGFTYT